MVYDLEIKNAPESITIDDLNEICRDKGKVIDMNLVQDIFNGQKNKNTILRLKDSSRKENVKEVIKYLEKFGCDVSEKGKFALQSRSPSNF